jgi:myo-inositol-1(or 4)-monophosphatase
MANTFLDFAISFVKQGGEIMKRNFSLQMKKEWKYDNTPVTETDIAINNLLIEEISKKFPTHNIIGEEKSSLGKISEYTRICDPVD